MFDSGVPAWLRTDEPLRWFTTAGEFRHPRSAPLALAGFVVTALVTVVGTQSMTEAPSASADTSDRVEVDTQRTTDANLNSHQDGSYRLVDQLTSVCSNSGQDVTEFSSDVPGRANDLWYRTSDGQVVADADTETGTLNVAAPECSSEPPGVDAGRATGRTREANPGTEGQCTWGAAQKWFEASGSYPALSGDAMSWSGAATAAGWTVSDDPQDRSIVVFQPGVAGAGGVGHVAWVDSVSQRPDGQSIHVTEMNNSYLGGVGVFNDRDVMDTPGMSYILLP